LETQRLAREERRILRQISLALLVIFSFLEVPQKLHASEKIRLTVSNLNMSFLTAGVALRRGFFKDEGLDAEVIRMRVPVMITALSTGDIDYTMVFGSVVRAALRGLPVKVVASFLDGSAHALIARPEFQSVRELGGRTLGIESHGASSDVVARMMIKHFGIDPEKEMKIVALGSDQARLAALKEGLVDVAVISPPADAEGKRMGFNVLSRAYELFKFPFVGLGVNAKTIQEKPDQVKRTLKALIKANRYIRQNREGSIQVLTEWARVEPDLATVTYDSTWKVFSPDGSVPEDGLRLVVEQAKKELRITREVSLGDVSAVTLVRDAQRELGIQGR
jgi:NitT/TauT family transport system substrate-binding protein